MHSPFAGKPHVGKQVAPTILGGSESSQQVVEELARIKKEKAEQDERTAKEEQANFPDPEDACLKSPLYAEYPANKNTRWHVKNLRCFAGNFDAHCVGCQKDSTFKVCSGVRELTPDQSIQNGHSWITLACSRNNEHVLHFIFHIRENVITKIGQHPSIATLASAKIKDYRRVLTPSRRQELNRAIGLISHSVGIGAFVYLRRIFEGLVEDAYQIAQQEKGWKERAFKSERMDEKIKRLKKHVPAFLFEHRKLYSILSLGIHELTEEQCIAAFDVVRTGIEMILDEKLVELEKAEKAAQAATAIRSLGTSLDRS